MTDSTVLRLGYLIYTYDRVDDARIQMEIVRRLWEPVFGSVYLVHAFNGLKEWYDRPYLEDDLLVQDNPGHFEGAANLIDAGIAQLLTRQIDYIVVSAADTWWIKPAFIADKIRVMRQTGKVFLSTPWGLKDQNNPKEMGLAGDTFVLEAAWQRAYNFFPVQYRDFYDRYIELLRYLGRQNVSYEALLFSKFVNACHREIMPANVGIKQQVQKRMLLLEERIPVHTAVNEEGYWVRRFQWPDIGLLTDHDPEPKQQVLRAQNLEVGPFSRKLIESNDLAYYNGHMQRTVRGPY